MTTESRALALAAAAGADVKDLTVDQISGARLDKNARIAIKGYNKTILSRLDAATIFIEKWAATSNWAGTGTVVAGRAYSSAGLTRAAPAGSRWVARATLHATGSASKYAYFGAGASTAAGDLAGIGQGSASTSAAILYGANLATQASNLFIPRSFPALTAGDYLCTVARDETYVSFTIQKTTGAQDIWHARIPVSAFPGGVVNTIFISANDTAGSGLNWGPLTIYSELAVPPAAAWNVGAVDLWGVNKPLAFYRADTTGIAHLVSVPGNDDPTTPSPVMVFLHQATTGVAISPWSEARMANIVAAMEGAGYIICSSDNGTGMTGGGTQDKFANQASQNDYAALIDYVRQHFYTGSLVLLGPSQGSFVAQNLLMNKLVGEIAAVATISGGSNLLLMEQDPTYQAALWTAYSVASTGAFVTAATPFDPATKAGWRFRGVPQRFYVGATDTTAPPATQVTPFVNKIAPYSDEESVVTVAGVGHLDTSLYQGTDLLAFYQKYVHNSDYAALPDFPTLQLKPPIRWSAETPTITTTGTDRASYTRYISEVRMRVGSAPVGSAMAFDLQHWDGFTWTTLVSLSCPAGSTTEQVSVVSQYQLTGNMLRLNVTSVGSTTPAGDVVVDVTTT